MTRPKPCWITIDEGGDYHPWPEWHSAFLKGYSRVFRIHSVGFDDGSVFDNMIGWRTWSADRVPESLLQRMGLQRREPAKMGFWKRLFGRVAVEGEAFPYVAAQTIVPTQAAVVATAQAMAKRHIATPLYDSQGYDSRGRRHQRILEDAQRKTEDSSGSVLPYLVAGYAIGAMASSPAHAEPAAAPSYSGGGGDFGGGGSSSSWDSGSSSSSSFDSGSSSSGSFDSGS